jgi:hypothetical protein
MYDLYVVMSIVAFVALVWWRIAAAFKARPAPSAEPAKPPLGEMETVLKGLRYPLEIRYRDAAGTETARPIIAMKLMGRPTTNGKMQPVALGAFCEKRNAARTFLLSRIVEAIDSETGEILSDIVGRLTEVAAERTARAVAKPRKRR